MKISISGRHFINASRGRIRLRGANYSGFEFVAAQGWNPDDPSGAQAGQAGGPNYAAMKAWKLNTVRIPLNEASWLGLTCTDTDGVSRSADPGRNYQTAVREQVWLANAAKMYVILDLHWSAPFDTMPLLQTQMANAQHSLTFWTSIAETFKDNRTVMFELFNEPFFTFGFSGDPWAYMMKGTGGAFTSYPATSTTNTWLEMKRPWAVASYQAMVDAVRATGAQNVILVGCPSYAQDLSGWLAHKPSDPLYQMAAVFHPYPTYGKGWGTPEYALPNFAPQVFLDAQAILRAGIPVIATETGDRNVDGTVGAPLVTTVGSWANKYGVSLLGWGWNVWGNPENVLIKDAAGTPTSGYGEVFQAWSRKL